MAEPSRADHLTWCKQRALQYVDRGDLTQAYTSLVSDLNNHPGTRGHAAIELGMMQLMAGMLNTPGKMRDFVNGCG